MKRQAFGSDAENYIREQLASGYSLARKLLSLPLEQGRFWAFVPDAVPLSKLGRFSSGGLGDLHDMEEALRDFIATDLRNSDRRAAVFEDALARAGDPNLSQSAVGYITHGSDVLEFLTSESATNDLVLQLIRTASSFTLRGVLSDIDSRLLVPGASIASEIVVDLAANARHVIVGAWDGEGALVWSRA